MSFKEPSLQYCTLMLQVVFRRCVLSTYCSPEEAVHCMKGLNEEPAGAYPWIP